MSIQNFHRVSDINIPEELFNTLKTGTREIDYTFSEIGGVVPSQVTLITGNPGSGKTTLAAVIASKIVQAGLERGENRPAVFLSYEMSDFQLKMQARKIPGFQDLLVSTHEYHKDKNGLSELFTTLDAIRPQIIIVDSLQKMASKMAQGMNNGQIYLVQEFTRWAKATFTPVLMIGHNSKGGDYAGPSFLKHEVDAHLVVWHDKETSERMFAMSKNRFGGNIEQYGFRITPDGVFIGNEWLSKFSSASLNEVSDIIMDFKTSGKSEGSANWLKFTDAATVLISHLNHKYETRFNKTFIGSPERVRIRWEGKRFCCASRTGDITLGRKFFEKITDSNFTGLGYHSEKPFIRKYAKNREEVLLWAVIHEWVHLFKGYQRHSKRMWNEITRIAHEESWLWS